MSRCPEQLVLHGSAVACRGRAVLILGKSGAGKSGLTLRLIRMGAGLVADDQVLLERRGRGLIAKGPEALAGLVESRGGGLLRMAHVPEAVVTLVVDLDFAPAARMPQRGIIRYHDVAVELISGRDMPNLDAVLWFIMQNVQRPE